MTIFFPPGDRSLFFLYFGSLSDFPVVNQLINQKSVISVGSLYSTVIYIIKCEAGVAQSVKWLGFGRDDPGFESMQQQETFFQNIQSGFGAHPGSYLMQLGGKATCGVKLEPICDWRIWHSEDRASWYILIMKANEMHNFSYLFDKVLYMFRTCPVSIIRSISALYTQQ
jgi:hypothetical protein